MGTDYNRECSNGIIPNVMQTIFKHVEETKGNTEYLIRVSFIEIFKEEVFDLLKSSTVAYSKGDGNGKGTGPSRAPIQIREAANGGISLAGVTEAEVTSQEEMASFLRRGSVCRATRSTNMNSQSSRSHAIFTISMEQKRIAGTTSGGGHDDVGDDILSAKLHLVDLAGSERAKKTGADGMRLQEGIHINKALLALGNVISALGDDKKRKGGHVPYRDSKLTRLLQDSLGGNSKTVMIACVSPADTNAEETLNTLKYANRARNIQNKAIVNRDPVTAQMQMMKNQIEQLQAELRNVKGDSPTPVEEPQILKQKIAMLERSNADLQKQLQKHQVNVEYLTKQVTDAQFEKDELLRKLESAARDGKPWDEIDCDSNKGLRNSIAFYGSGNMEEPSEDMDASESEHSYEEDIESEQSDKDDPDWQPSEDEMGRKRIQTAKKRNSKIVMENNTESEENTTTIQKTHSGTCCTCSKYSSCKTSKCECRVISGFCSVSCGCHPKICSNREPASVEDSDLKPTVTVGNVNQSDDEEVDRNSNELASQGAMLLQAALSDKPAEKKCSNREPASVEDSDLKPTVTVGNVNQSDDEEVDRNSSELARQGAMLLQSLYGSVLAFRNNGEVLLEDDNFEESRIEVYDPLSGHITTIGDIGIYGRPHRISARSYLETAYLSDQPEPDIIIH